MLLERLVKLAAGWGAGGNILQVITHSVAPWGIDPALSHPIPSL